MNSGEQSAAKRQYKEKVESDFKGCNTRNMWAGLRTMTDYKGAAGVLRECLRAHLSQMS